jgi:hypothetical protein
MYDWIDLELARQRREELLREAHERRVTRAPRHAPGRELTTRVRHLMRLLQPAQNEGIAAAEKPPGIPLHGCSAD